MHFTRHYVIQKDTNPAYFLSDSSIDFTLEGRGDEREMTAFIGTLRIWDDVNSEGEKLTQEEMVKYFNSNDPTQDWTFKLDGKREPKAFEKIRPFTSTIFAGNLLRRTPRILKDSLSPFDNGLWYIPKEAAKSRAF